MKKIIIFISIFILIIITTFSSAQRTSLSNNEVELLSRIIYAEAKGEPYIGQVAVGAVILNRIDNPDFPNTLSGVIYQPLAFEPVQNGTINQAVPQNADARKAAQDALNGYDPTGGCLYFYNPATAKSKWIWSKQIVKTIGKHNFAK